VSALTCLNYILDLNVRLTSSIVKCGGVKKIVNMTQNIEYIDCAENAIKAIEKMSYENPYLILEMDAFQGVLSLIDFFDLNLRKSALKACVNMSKSFSGLEQIKKFVFPALPSLANLTKYTGNSEIEKNILDAAVQCYFNVLNYIKIYNISGINENVCNSLIQGGFLQNMFELFVNYLEIQADANKNISDSLEFTNSGNKNYKIHTQTFKNIIRIFEMICSLSAEITNTILNLNILEILNTILVKELTVESTKKKLSSGSGSCYIEIFNLLISLFPTKKSKQPDRLLSVNNKNFYVYFAEKILSFLLNNIVNISSSNTMVLVLKLVEMFIKNSNSENVEKYIDPFKLSNIAGKMLDSRDSTYILEVFNLVEIIMNKIPENFFISFLREGVVDNIKNLSEIEENKLYIPNDSSKILSNSAYLYSDNLQFGKKTNSKDNFKSDEPEESYGDDLVEEDEIAEDWDLNFKDSNENVGNIILSNSGVKNNLHKDKLIENVVIDNRQKEFLNFINKKMEMKNRIYNENTASISNTTNFIPIDKKIIKDEHVDSKIQNNPFITTNKIFDYESFSSNNVNPFAEDLSNQKEDNMQDQLSYKSISNSIKTNSNIIEGDKFVKNFNQGSYLNSITAIINLKAKEIIEKYFKDEDFEKFMQKSKSTFNPKDILQKLSNIKEILKNGEKVDSSVLAYLFEIILGKDKLTFYEIEKSEVMLYLTKFLDENFFQNYEDTTETDYKTTSNISGFHNKKIIQNLKMLLNAMNNDYYKINEFLKILQYCISSMNCFKLFLYDTGSSNYSSLLLTNLKTPKLRIKFVYNPVDISISKRIEEEIPMFKDIFEYIKTNKHISLVFKQTENFQHVLESMMKLRSEIKENNPSSHGMKDDYYEEIFTHLRNRKSSEEDLQFTEKMLQRLMERKKSSNSQELEDINEMGEEDAVRRKGSNLSNSTEKETEEDVNQKIANLEANYYVVINNTRMNIKNDWTVFEFLREIKSFYKRNEYSTFITDIQINFDLNFKSITKNIDTVLIKSIPNYENTGGNFNSKEPIILDIESNIELVKKGSYESMLFERFYRDTLINNPSLYSIKRASPFFYIIALLELSLTNFRNLFDITENVSNINTLNNLENLKISTLLFKQAKDIYSISSGNLPKWCKQICQSFTYLAGFNSRYLLYKISSFDNRRSLSNLYIYLKTFMGETIFEDKTLSQNKRTKFRVDRNNLIRDTEKLMKEFTGYKGYLEFEYHDEVGTGLGPTLEFYSLFAKEIRNISNIWFKTDDYSLFPLPIDQNNPLKTEDNLKIFRLLGFVIARGLYDDRLIDFPINSLFWDLALDRPVGYEKIKKIDKNLGKTVNDFVNIIAHKQKLISTSKALNNYTDLNEILTYKNVKIEDLSITFTLPGHPEIELKRGGEESILTINNIEEYVGLLFDKLVLTGCKSYIEAFKSGFNKVFPITNMKTFSSSELEDIICGSSNEKWDYESLIENIIPAHGYHKNSQIYAGLIDIMINMSSIEKKKFLLFSTGSQRLPLGGKYIQYKLIFFYLLLGFKNLNPKLTVVLKKNHLETENPDDYLPTVMTCQNFLKIPQYSSLNILKEKLLLAMEEGSNAFHLS